MQDCSNSIVDAPELQQSYTKPLICSLPIYMVCAHNFHRDPSKMSLMCINMEFPMVRRLWNTALSEPKMMFLQSMNQIPNINNLNFSCSPTLCTTPHRSPWVTVACPSPPWSAWAWWRCCRWSMRRVSHSPVLGFWSTYHLPCTLVSRELTFDLLNLF